MLSPYDRHCFYLSSASGQEAHDKCKEKNGTLSYITKRAQVDFVTTLIDGKTTNETYAVLWTKHLINSNTFEEGKVYTEGIPIENDMSDPLDSLLCVYANFSLISSTVEFVPSNCSTQVSLVFVCCLLFYESISNNPLNEAWTVKLFTIEVTWQEAIDHCIQKGGRLMDIIDDVDILNNVGKIVNSAPWKASGMKRFWIRNQMSVTDCIQLQEKEEIDDYNTVDFNVVGCDDRSSFLCNIPTTDTPLWVEIDNSVMLGYSLLKNDGQPHTIEECRNECERLAREGFICDGFNYNKANLSCGLTEAEFNRNNSAIYSTEWNYHFMDFFEILFEENSTTTAPTVLQEMTTFITTSSSDISVNQNKSDKPATKKPTISAWAYSIGSALVVAIASTVTLGVLVELNLKDFMQNQEGDEEAEAMDEEFNDEELPDYDEDDKLGMYNNRAPADTRIPFVL